MSQMGQGLRPPDLASLKLKAAASTNTLHSPRLGERRFACSHFRQWLYRGQEVLPLSDREGIRRGKRRKKVAPAQERLMEVLKRGRLQAQRGEMKGIGLSINLGTTRKGREEYVNSYFLASRPNSGKPKPQEGEMTCSP